MKKILSLVLALMMVLVAVSALAAGSKEEPTTGGDSSTIKIVPAEKTELSEAVIDEFKKAFGSNDPLAPLSDEAKAKLPADYTTVNEMLTSQFSGEVGAVEAPVEMNMKFETGYGEGETVYIAIGILPADATDVKVEDIEWEIIKGVGEADGSVTFTIPVDIVAKIGTNSFVIGAISQTKK